VALWMFSKLRKRMLRKFLKCLCAGQNTVSMQIAS
jgi:hypothetical protein